MKLIRKAGATSNILQIFIADSSSTTGGGLTGLVFNSGSLTAYYHRDTDTTATSMTLVTMTVGTFTSLGFKEIDATNMPGWYQFCPPDAALAAGAKSCAFHLKGAANMAPLPLEVQLVSYDPDDSVRLGLTAIPNATAGANGGLPLGVDSSGRVDVLKINGTSQTARDIGASVLLSTGTGTGQLDFTSGVVKANLAQILGTALTETAGLLAGGFKKFFNIATPQATMDHGILVDTVTTATTATNLTNAPSAGDFTATMKTSLNAATPAVTVSDKTGFSLSSAGLQAIWDALTSALTTAGSIGKLLIDNINATISSRSTYAGGDTAGTTTLLGRLTSGRATNLDNLDAAVSTRLATSGYTSPDNTGIAAAESAAASAASSSSSALSNTTAIKAKTDNLPASPAAVGSAMTLTTGERDSIATAFLKLDWTGITGEAARSCLNALRFLRNKWSVSTGTLTVTKENDTTTAWTGTVTTDPTAEPITGNDPS